MASFRTSKKKSYLTFGRKERRKNERKRWNLEDGVAMQDSDDEEVIVVKRKVVTAEEEDDKENHRSGSPSRCLLKQRFHPQGKSTWSTTPKEEAMLQDWVSELNYTHSQPDMGDLLNLLMSEGHEDLRTKLDGCKPEVRERFFDIIVEETEPAIDPEIVETMFHYEARVRDTGREMCASYESFRRRPFTVQEKHFSANEARRMQDHRVAFLTACDWVFAAAAAFSESMVVEIAEEEGEGTDLRALPQKFAYFDAKVSQVEALFLNKQFKKASIYGYHTIEWMARCEERGVEGFYATFYPERYALLQTWVSESEVKLGDYTRAILLSSKAIERHSTLKTTVTLEKSLFRSRQTIFEHVVDYFENSNGDEEDQIALDRADARIRVSPWDKHGYVNEQFVVNDLQTALTMAKDGDLIFLEEGTYKPDPPAKGKGGRGKFEVTKSLQIVGASTSTSVICGSLVKRGPGEVSFSRLKLVIGTTSNSNDDAYFMGGRTTFRHCVIESPVNTAMYVINVAPEKEGTFLLFQVCVLNGLESCHRLIAFQGPRPRILLQSCYVMDAFSLITVNSKGKDVPSFCHIQLVDTVLYDLQDGLKIVLPVLSRGALVEIVRCHIELFPRDNDRPSHAFSQVGGKAMILHNFVHNTNMDANGFSLHAMKSVKLIRNLVETPSEQSRAFAIAEGFVLSEVDHVMMDGLQVDGMRIGFNFANEDDNLNTYLVKDCTAKNCALGLMVRALSRQPIVAAASLGENSDEFCSQKNLDINLIGCQFDMCHYGVIVDDKRCSLAIMSTWFYDVPRPIYLARHALARFELRNNTYKYYTEKLVGPHDEEVSSDDQDETCKDPKELTKEAQELFSQVRSGNVEAATKVLETIKLIEKAGISDLESRASSSNDIPKLSPSENESTSQEDKPKLKVEKMMQKVDDPKDKEDLPKSDSGNVAEKSQQAPKYVTDAVKKVLEMESELDFKASSCNNIPKVSSSENESTSKQARTKLKANESTSEQARRKVKAKRNFSEPKGKEDLSEVDGGKDSIKVQEGKKNTNKPEEKESELNLKLSSFNDISKLSSSTLKQARPKLKAKKVKQNNGDPKCREGISEADCGKGTTKTQEGPQNAKEAVKKMKERLIEHEEVKCTASTCHSPIVVSLPLPAPRGSESTEEILRRLSPSITVSRSRSTSKPASPVTPNCPASPDGGYLDALGELGNQLRKAKLEEEDKSQQPNTILATTSVAKAVRAAMKARRGAAPVIPPSAFESFQHFSNADAMKDTAVPTPMPALCVEPEDEEMVVSRPHAEQRAKDMFLFFGMRENLPNRVAVGEGDVYTSVYQRHDELQLMTKYKNSRMIE